ncbi:MAG: FAD-dependent oxidoreductase [Hyphomicrobiaceae bacterium]|nr:FAD-dependent oxidoreductase [Hyphomicrobiaceae bacterium]
MTLPSHCQIVVIGGGIIGCSTAYHLAKLHKADVILLERDRLTSGSTWHAAGLVGQLRNSASITQLLRYSVRLYAGLEAETGLATGWRPSGCLRLARSPERMVEFKRQATTARSFGLEMHLLSPAEVALRWPLLETGDLAGASWLPSDGQANPSDIAQSLAKGARANRARVVEGAAVTGFDIRHGRVAGVRTSQGNIACEKVVNCAGQWARQLGALAGVSVPLQPMRHQYVVTEPVPGLPADLPTMRDPDRYTYFKEEVGGLAFGGYERNPKAWLDEPPQDFSFALLDDDWELFEQHLANALARVPALATTGIKRMIAGPESFTPDGNFILGEAPEVAGFFVGAGFNSFGIASAGGAGMALAEWIVRGEQPTDLWSVDIRRFSGLHRDRDWVRERTLEAYGKHYTVAFPHEEMQSGRPRLMSPLYGRLDRLNACFGSKLGWERANWFAPSGSRAEDVYAMGRQSWFEAVGREHRAVRERAGLFDQSSFAKFEVSGAGAAAALSWLSANDVAKAPGRVTYTQMLNSRGGIECDLTVARLADDRFYVVTGTGFRTHDAHWICSHLPAGADVTFRDVTEEFGTLSLMGPRARQVLSRVTDADLGNAAFPFGHCRQIGIADRPVRALRVSYVGELGWELHAPATALPAVFDALMEAGEPLGLTPAGYRAIESLRLEKAYRAWGADLSPSDNPLEAGLVWAVKLRASTPFLGREPCERAAREPLTKRFTVLTVDDPSAVLVGRETILRDGAVVGYLTSGGWGYTVRRNIGLGYVRHPEGVTDAFLGEGHYELEIATERFPATLHLSPLHDPGGARLRA